MNKTLTIYKLLKVLNIVVLFMLIYTYVECGDNQYIDEETIWINGLMCVLTHIILLDAERNKNAILGVLSFVMIIHFELRIVTLNWTEYSTIMRDNVTIGTNGINKILIYVFASYVLTWVGLRFNGKLNNNKEVSNEVLKPKATKNVLLVLYISFLVTLLGAIGVPGMEQMVGILSVYFLNMGYLMLLGIGYFIYNWSNVSRNEKILMIAFLVIYIVVFTGIGRRGTIYDIVIMSFFSLLSLDKVYIKYRYLLLGFALLPLMVWTFSFSTLTRQHGQKTLSVKEAAELSRELSSNMEIADMRRVLTPVFDRIAFFDFTVELVQNSNYLRNYLTPANYSKSVVDNILTPGFDLFDMPKMSIVLGKCYSITETPTKTRYNKDDYLSSGMSWYGEAYLLFGKNLVFPVLFTVAAIFRHYYARFVKKKSLTSIWKQSIALYLFYALLYSYGLDWWLLYLVSFLIIFTIFKYLTVDYSQKMRK